MLRGTTMALTHTQRGWRLTKHSAQPVNQLEPCFFKRQKCELWMCVSGFSPEEEEEKKRFPSFSDGEMWHLARRGCFTGLFSRGDVHSHPGVMGNFKWVAARSVGKQNINRVLPTIDHTPSKRPTPHSALLPGVRFFPLKTIPLFFSALSAQRSTTLLSNWTSLYCKSFFQMGNFKRESRNTLKQPSFRLKKSLESQNRIKVMR